MKKRTKKKTGILLLAAVLLLGIVVTIRVITDRGQTKDRISVAEAENELEEAIKELFSGNDEIALFYFSGLP